MKVFRYLVSGGSGAVVNIGSFFLMVHVLGVWYLAGSVIAFILSFLVSFSLQRYWTFEQRSREDLIRHATLYFLVALGNLGLNTVVVYVLVHHLDTFPVLAQFIGGIAVSVSSYFIYRNYVFTLRT